MKKQTIAIILSIFLVIVLVSASVIENLNVDVSRARKQALQSKKLDTLTYQIIDTNNDNYVKLCMNGVGMSERCSSEIYDITNTTALREVQQSMVEKLSDDIIDAQPTRVVEREGTISVR